MSRKSVLAAAFVAVALAAALVLALTPAQATESATGARAATVVCGQTITSSITVANDLVDCPANGLVIGANGVVVDLGGHSIGGVAGDSSFGVLVSGVDNVTVRNGSVTGFETGVQVTADANGAKLLGLRSHGNREHGIFVNQFSDGALVRGTNVYANGEAGIGVSSSRNATVANNRAAANGFWGIALGDADGSVLTGNRVVSNDVGVSVSSVADNVQVKGTTATSNDRYGLSVAGTRVSVSGTVANFNTQLGINATPGITDGGGNHARGNGFLHQCENIVCT